VKKNKMVEVKLHFLMWPPNIINKPNLAFVIPTFNIVFPKEKKSFVIDELGTKGTFGQNWVQSYLDLEIISNKYSKGDCLVCDW
jgi:hypothetical protein